MVQGFPFLPCTENLQLSWEDSAEEQPPAAIFFGGGSHICQDLP